VPGYHWAPAWVTWGYYDGYYGWAPLAPGVSFSVGYYPPIDYWVFVPPRYVTVSGWHNTYYTAYNNRIALDNNTYISNVRNINVVDNTGNYSGQRFSAGPSRTEFEKAANTKVDVVSIRDNNAPGKARVIGNNLSIYRPSVETGNNAAAKPSKITSLETMKRSEGSRINSEVRTKNRVVEAEKAPQIKSREHIDKTAAEPARKERVPEKQAAPQQKSGAREQIKMQERRQEIQRRTETVQPQQKVRQPQPKPNVERAPQMREQKNVAPAPKQPKTAPAERMQQPPQREPQAAPERQQMEKQIQREPRYQPQPQQRETRGHNNPK
jgi:hypothetical protein